LLHARIRLPKLLGPFLHRGRRRHTRLNLPMGNKPEHASFPNSCLGTPVGETLFRVVAATRNGGSRTGVPKRSLGTRDDYESPRFSRSFIARRLARIKRLV